MGAEESGVRQGPAQTGLVAKTLVCPHAVRSVWTRSPLAGEHVSLAAAPHEHYLGAPFGCGLALAAPASLSHVLPGSAREPGSQDLLHAGWVGLLPSPLGWS